MRNIDPSIRRRHAAIEEKLIPQTSAQSWSGRICSPRTIQSRRLPRCAPTAGSLIGIDFSSSHGDRPGKMTQRPERRRNGLTAARLPYRSTSLVAAHGSVEGGSGNYAGSTETLRKLTSRLWRDPRRN